MIDDVVRRLADMVDEEAAKACENGVSAVTMYADGSFTLNCRAYSKGERVNRPAPKALDAEGNRIEPAMDVWWVCEDDERGVLAEKLHVESIGEDGLVECSPYNGGTWVYLEPSELYVNRPVLAADGKPLEVGQTVWRDDGEMLEVLYLLPDGLVDCCGEIERPERLTHERTVLDADGKPLRVGETVWHKQTGRAATVKGFDRMLGEPCAVIDFAGIEQRVSGELLTHERPVADTWERLRRGGEKGDCRG